DGLTARNVDWLRDRARRYADLFDGYRVDHLVGFYRTYFRPHNGSAARVTPADPADQEPLGERALTVFREPGAEIIAEDLGTVPDFVRDSLARLEVPGFKVLRWEREWQSEGMPFRSPSMYPPASVAASGTHDTEPMAVWWAQASEEPNRDTARTAGVDPRDAPSDPGRDVLVQTILESGSELALLPIQDVFGWRD